MTNGQDELLSRLSLLQVCCERFSHSTRTKLGIALGVIEDCMAGIPLSKQDLQDGLDAVKSIVFVLDSLKPLIDEPNFRPAQARLSDLFSPDRISRCQLKPQTRFVTDFALSPVCRPLDLALLQRGVLCLLRYAEARQQRFPHTEAQLKLCLTSARHSPLFAEEILELSINHGPAVDYDRIKQLSEIKEICIADHCPESLGLLFALDVFALHGGISRLEQPDCQTVIFRIIFNGQ